MYHHVYSSHVSRDFAPDEDSQINTNIVLAEEPLHPQLLLQLWAKIVLEHLMVHLMVQYSEYSGQRNYISLGNLPQAHKFPCSLLHSESASQCASTVISRLVNMNQVVFRECSSVPSVQSPSQQADASLE